ncbi:tripartite tricarboxylate transporter substrate binding protein [Variovorax sp. J22G21]|uniref:Bug family tripartite tricarboxylate transporter substrate binding protein n=1 Tax=Variovorax fucosicus TaxID=3053517 RepID=UPI002574A9FA|nr:MULTISPECIES: tripartite tricarboxylate transporter substrate binding protein [unclassified Variovorax]MDM0037517.1 tripartite tricarboxylate transporter substrate binding protein [Variovorax sp. J22R193]MDM0056813.1 tripartite tricarboxylate transporter substrate binding protein [Variovorax sp. J22G47]MDM0062293.1 tripartite tricarboxylate transporter substrate binding protein [Variovorax sp. J22G21]
MLTQFQKLFSSGCASLVLALTAFAPLGALADEYPHKAIRLITPNSAGSSTDNVARRLSERLGVALGQPVFVDNLPGAGGVLGTEALVRAPKDGYTIGLVSSNHVIFPHMYKNLRFDSQKDTTPIATVGTAPMLLVARSDFAANNAEQLIALAKQKPGALTMASSGNGTILHLVGELMQSMGGFQLTHVPYKGVAPALPDVVSGQVDVGFFGQSSVEGLIKQGRLKVLGVTSTARIPQLPNVAPIAAVVPGFSFEGWYAVIGPAGLPPAVMKRLNAEVNTIVASDGFKVLLAQDGTVPRTMSLAQTRDFVDAEYLKHGNIVRSTGATNQ